MSEPVTDPTLEVNQLIHDPARSDPGSLTPSGLADGPDTPALDDVNANAPAAAAGRSEWERMVSGEGEPFRYGFELIFYTHRLRARQLMRAYNTFPFPDPAVSTDYSGPDERRAILANLFRLSLEEIKNRSIYLEPPFLVNNWFMVTSKGSFFSNTDLVILDDAPVTIGNNVICGPRVGIYAATHSTNVDERQAGYDRAYPIEIGDDCWIGGGAIINGPCKIGKGCTVAAGAVVRGEFPDHCLIGGVPARIIKRLDPQTGRYDPHEHGRRV